MLPKLQLPLPLSLFLLAGLALGCATASPPASPELSSAEQRVETLLGSLHVPEFARRLEEIALRVAGHPRDEKLAADERLRPRIEAQLEPRAVVLDVVRSVAGSLDASTLTLVERYYATQTGREVAHASRVPYSWLSRLGYRMFGSLTRRPADRVALVTRLDELTRTRESTADLYVNLYGAIVRWYAAHGFLDETEAKAVGGIDGLIERQREQTQALGEKHLVPYALWVLGGLSTAELAEYVAFVESQPGQAFTSALRAALDESIGRRAAAIER